MSGRDALVPVSKVDAVQGESGRQGVQLSPDHEARIASWAERGVAEATRTAYTRHARDFVQWADQVVELEWTAALTDRGLAAYLTDRADGEWPDGRPWSPATCRQAVTALGHLAREQGLPAPYGVEAKSVMRGIARSVDDPRGPALGLRREQMIETALRAAAGGRLLDLRDGALIRVMHDCLLRVSEAAALDVGDLTFEPDGSGSLRIRRSKTDQEGKGQSLHVTPATVRAVRFWLGKSGIEDGPLFRPVHNSGKALLPGRMSAQTVRYAVRQRTAAAGFGGMTGHSCRRGAAQDLVAGGATLPEVQDAGRWKDPAMPGRYAAGELAGQGCVARIFGTGK